MENNLDSVLYMRHTLYPDSDEGMGSDSNHHSSRDILLKLKFQRKIKCLNTIEHETKDKSM